MTRAAFEGPVAVAASQASTDKKNGSSLYDHTDADISSQPCVSSSGDESHGNPDTAPLSRGKAIALVITLTGAAFINVSSHLDCFPHDHLTPQKCETC